MSLIVGVGPGSDSKVGEDKIKAYKNFANKIWNATRFVLTSVEGAEIELDKKPELIDSHQAHIEELHNTLKDVTLDMDNFRYYLAGEKLYHYFWHVFADKIIEESKSAVLGNDPKAKLSAQWMLLYILATTIKALHPFMPFVTEEIWSELPIKNKTLLMVERWGGIKL